ncbi:hypothetical protein E0Z10_g1610 [Xylaria hypoxylon]|uniref:Rhodopsin domain-containing protein n=1 Tax=Xylaria hypoxylon TaxID=37992 RepID=A0A4Z0YT19_9PEZI|nr:hypothetical protein E0Z10_g1610 [Xylaria hypoxylon]
MDAVGSDDYNQETQSPMVIAASVITLFLTLGSIGARTYTKAAVMRQFDLTDWVLLLAGALFGAFVSVEIRLWYTPAGSAGDAQLIFNILEIIYSPAIFCAKYVVLRQIELIFFNHDRKALAFTAIRILVWANLLFYASSFISFLLACIPRAKISNPTLPGVCIDPVRSIIVAGAINVISDLAILVTPIAVIWRLQIPFKRKIGAIAVFGVGVLANITGIIGLYYSIQLTDIADFASAIIPVASWALGDFTTVILVACFPYFPRLYQHLSQKHQKSRYPIPNDVARSPNETRPSRTKPGRWNNSLTTLEVLEDGEGDAPIVGIRPNSS